MIAPLPALPLPFERAVCSACPPGAEEITARFEDVLAAIERSGTQQEAATAFDTCSMFGVKSPVPTFDMATVDASAASAPVQLTTGALSALEQQSISVGQAPQNGAQLRSSSPHHDLISQPTPPMSRTAPARLLPASIAPPRSHIANAARTSTRASAFQPSGDAKVNAISTPRPHNLQPLAIAVQETEQGLRVIARACVLDPDDLTQLRSEAEALLARHGYRVVDLDIAAARKE